MICRGEVLRGENLLTVKDFLHLILKRTCQDSAKQCLLSVESSSLFHHSIYL